jgi:gamma-glutamylcyclotransferase (GGCT)/AIG2-like uncharacterized protein YtfP
MSSFDGEYVIKKGTMIDFGPFPGLIIGDGDTDIECLLVGHIDKEILKRLDYYEGVQDSFYTREKVDDFWYYKPKGVITWHNAFKDNSMKEVSCKTGPFNWMRYKKDDGKKYNKKDIPKEKLVRLAKG